MFKYLLKRDTFLCTLLVFVLMGLLALIPFNTHVLDPIKMALQDFDYNDLVYAQMGKNKASGVDTGMAIVNIEDADRAGIVQVLEKIAAQKPAAIGVDVLFNAPREAATDSALQAFFIQNKNAVLAYHLQWNKESAEAQGFLYPQVPTKGFVNFVGEDGGVIRHFIPSVKADDGTLYESFAKQIVSIADAGAARKLEKRGSAVETILYSRTPDKYLQLSGTELMSDSSIALSLHNKIVLVGFVSPHAANIEDKHFTPFNAKSVGKSVPDMNGIFIHANIISMIKAGTYVSKSPAWFNWLLAILLCWLHMAIFIRYFLDKHLWFHLVAKTVQVVSAILFVYLGLLFYYKWNIKINLIPVFVAIILAVDVLYFYEAILAWLHKKWGVSSIFIHHHHGH